MVTTDKVTVAEFFPHIGKTTTDYKENDMGVREKGNADYEKGYRKGYQNGFQSGRRIINKKVKVKDFSNLEEVVRCTECIYNSNNTDDDNEGWCYKHGIDIIGFCSEGE